MPRISATAVKAGRLHYILTGLDHLSSEDLLEKARERQAFLVGQRAVALATARHLKELRDAIPVATLFDQAREMHRGSFTKQEEDFPVLEPTDAAIAAAINAEIAVSTEGISEEVILAALAIAALTQVRSTTRRLGIGTPALWRQNPSAALALDFPDLDGRLRAEIAASTQTFRRRAAVAISNAADPIIGIPATSLQAQVSRRLTRNAQQTGRFIVVNETQTVIAGARRQLMRDTGVEERRLITLEDTKVEGICLRDAAARWIPIDQPYPSGAMHPPEQHPNCRCSERPRTAGQEIPAYLRS